MPASRVSVVIPCYNYGRYLRECVGTVVEQTGVEVRVLIVDDGSTDDSASVASELAAGDPRIELRRHAVNHGHIATYNEGLQWATEPYALLLSADDLLTPGALQRACALLDAHPDVGFVYGRPLVFRDDRHRPQPANGPGRWTIRRGRDWFAARCHTAENCVRSAEVVVRSRLLRQLGGYRDELPHTADLEMWMRLALYADVGYIIDSHQAYYRDHVASMRHQRFGTSLADLMQVRAAFVILFHDHGAAIVDRSRLEAVATCALARRALRAACRIYDWGPLDLAQAAGLESLARSLYPDAEILGEARGLRWRKRLGAPWCRRLQPGFVITHAQRLRRELTRRRLRRAGLG
ncbi:MAG TPA: glycosyltransferase family 2 protein [Candidatus Acidoferrales bacterium]|nr:glycosyltransferase family 2 protein [Candidatus Acidoferrales bacterium]